MIPTENTLIVAIVISFSVVQEIKKSLELQMKYSKFIFLSNIFNATLFLLGSCQAIDINCKTKTIMICKQVAITSGKLTFLRNFCIE